MRWNHCVLKLQAKGDTVYSCNLATSNKKRVSRNNVALIYLKMLWKYGVYRFAEFPYLFGDRRTLPKTLSKMTEMVLRFPLGFA